MHNSTVGLLTTSHIFLMTVKQIKISKEVIAALLMGFLFLNRLKELDESLIYYCYARVQGHELSSAEANPPKSQAGKRTFQ